MKNLWILCLAVALGFTAHATPLDDKMKNFADALNASAAAKPDANPMMAERIPAMMAQLDSSLGAQGGEANMEAMIKQIMATNPAPAVQETGKALIAELDARQKARVDELTAKVNAVLTPIPEVLIKAQKPQDVDGVLGDLQKTQAPRGGMYGGDQDSQVQMNRINSAYQFVAQWQDYLSARNNGNIQEAQNSLRNLLNSRQPGDVILVPRSEILARTAALVSPTKPGPAGTPPVAVSNQDQLVSLLDGIKTLDDIDEALKKIRTLPNINYDAGGLAQLGGLYANAKNGLPVTFDLAPVNGSNANSLPEFARIRAMVIMYLLPRYIGSGAFPTNPNETVNDYLTRSIDAFETKQDWVSLQRLIEAQTKITGANAYSAGIRSFLAGLNQEMAGQYTQAVTSYQSALANPDDYLPAKLIGDKLAAIKKDHPAEFEAGMKNILNPPTPVYMNPYWPRVGIPVGYPMPVAGPGGTNAAPVVPTPPSPPASTNAVPVAPAPPPK